MTENKTLTFPRLHLNGTSAQDLLDTTFDAYHAVNAAIEALGKAAPNGRDFYTISAYAYNDAVNENIARIQALRNVAAELEQIMESVSDQRDQHQTR